MMNAPGRALLSGSQPGCVLCCLPQGSREPPHREVEEVEAGSVLARKLPTRATRFCRDPSKRWSRGHGRPGQRTRQQGRSRVWGQTDHLRGLALAEEGISSTRRSVFYARNLEAEEPGKLVGMLGTIVRCVLGSRAVWQCAEGWRSGISVPRCRPTGAPGGCARIWP